MDAVSKLCCVKLPEGSISILGVGDVDAWSKHCCVILLKGSINILSVGV